MVVEGERLALVAEGVGLAEAGGQHPVPQLGGGEHPDRELEGTASAAADDRALVV